MYHVPVVAMAMPIITSQWVRVHMLHAWYMVCVCHTCHVSTAQALSQLSEASLVG